MAASFASRVARIRRVALALPEAVEVRAHPERDRTNPAESGVFFRVRRRPFAQVLDVVDREGRRSTVLLLRADPAEAAALTTLGHPYFPAGGADRVGIVLDDGTDWAEVGELVTESFRRVAPKALR